MKAVYPMLALDTAWQRGSGAATQFASRIARLKQAAVDLGLEAGAVHLAAEIAALEPDLNDEARFALVVLIVISQAALAEGSTRFPVSGDAAKEPLERKLEALMPAPIEAGARARVAEKIAAILESDGAPAVIGRNRDARRPLLFLKPYLYHERIYHAEQRLAERLAALVDRGAAALNRKAIANALADVAARPAIKDGATAMLSSEQLRAVEIAVSSGLAIISGGPGTGKTSIIAAILRVLARLGVSSASVALAAPTGKAAHRMNESIRNMIAAIERPAAEDLALRKALPASSTIHRLLGYSSTRRAFLHHRGNPLEAEVVIVDEASMLDLTLMERLAGAMRPGARIVIIGDADQIPSVAAGAVLRDLLPAAGKGETLAMAGACITLSENYRVKSDNAGGGAIGLAAARINEGRTDLISAHDSPVERRKVAGEIAFSGVEFLAGAWESLPPFLARFSREQVESDEYAALAGRTYALEGGKFRPDDLTALKEMLQRVSRARILCLTRIGRFGADAVNARMHREALLRAGLSQRAQMIAGEPVIVLRNDYGHMLFNGDQGVLVNLAERSGRRSLAAVFERDTRLEAFRIEMLSDAIDLCYAMTVHKAQGSEFDCVGLILPEHDLPLLSREMIYTAVSRSRHSCVILGDEDLLKKAIARRIDRFSGLTDAISTHRAKPPGR
jgi:exodeoxyribonuclease V alpha subunit